jgi:glycosyltransferase involved in cell wall biosynthesis
MTADAPLVSIGLPVHNGEQYLEASIQSLLGQSYRNLELIICDNASTDATRSICERIAEGDSRVRYHRNESNIGGANNHNLTFTLSRGKYFRWAAHDDIAEPELIKRCVEVLESNEDVVVCHTDFVQIDEDNQVTGRVSRNHCSSANPADRFAAMSSASDFCEETYGLIRADIFARTELQQDYTGSDRTLMSEIALYGPFQNIEQTLFRKRLHEGNQYIDWRTRMAWFGEEYKGKIVFPWWTGLFDYLRVVRRVPLRSPERAQCYWHIGRWVVVKSPKLVKDLALAGAMVTKSRSARLKRFDDTENWA